MSDTDTIIVTLTTADREHITSIRVSRNDFAMALDDVRGLLFYARGWLGQRAKNEALGIPKGGMMAKTKHGWLKESGSLEYRRTLNGAQVVVRPHRKPDGPTEWMCAIHRDDRPVEVTTHATYWEAMAYAVCEA